MPINPSFIDVDFPRDPRYTKGDLGVRPGYACAKYADNAPVIAESQWPELVRQMDASNSGLDQLVTRIYDQKNEGSCVANACSQSVEIVQCAQVGKANVVHLSAISLYKRIGSSPNSGAMVSDGLDELSERGILPLDTPENRAKYAHVMPNTGFRTQYPSGWEETAKKFRGTEWFVCESKAEVISALLNGHPVVVGRAGHSICYTRPVYENGRLLVKYANSWAPDWNDHGFGYDSESMIRSASGWAFALRAVVVNL